MVSVIGKYVKASHTDTVFRGAESARNYSPMTKTVAEQPQNSIPEPKAQKSAMVQSHDPATLINEIEEFNFRSRMVSQSGGCCALSAFLGEGPIL